MMDEEEDFDSLSYNLSEGTDEDAAPIPRGRGGVGWSSRQSPEGRREDSPGGNPDMPRNAPCPCGSGKRYKSCHGKLT